MKRVTFKEALHVNSTFQGTFDCIRGPYKKAGQKRDCMFKILKEGAVTRVHAWAADYTMDGESSNVVELHPDHPTVAVDEMSDENIAAIGKEIRSRFRVLNKLIEGIISGHNRSVVVSGAPGIGKTFLMDERLQRAEDDGEINKVSTIKGRISAIALFAQLYEHRHPGDVLILDDADVFSDETTLDLLKAAVDTTKTRHMTWQTASTWLEENGIDSEFDFDGCCVFITNKDFDRIIESGSSLSVHVEALMSRSVYLDMGIHTKLEIMVRVDHVIKETAILKSNGLSTAQGELLTDWLWDHYSMMREISIRSVGKLATFIKTDPDWEEMAAVTQIKLHRRGR